MHQLRSEQALERLLRSEQAAGRQHCSEQAARRLLRVVDKLDETEGVLHWGNMSRNFSKGMRS